MDHGRVFRDVLLVICVLLCCVSSGCCHINLEEFRQSTLGSQITQYQQAKAAHCITNDRVTLLDIIADHGCPAAEAMTTLLDARSADFPVEDAFTVLSFVHFGGCDLRHHPVMAVLRRFQATSPDAAVRAAASRTIHGIETFDPEAKRKSHK